MTRLEKQSRLLANVAEIPLKEARAKLRAIEAEGVFANAYLKAVNDYSNRTSEPFLVSFEKFQANPALLLAAKAYA